MRVKQDRRVAWRRVGDEAVLVIPVTDEVLVLNEIAIDIWEKCEGEGIELSQLSELMSSRHDADPQRIKEEVSRFASELMEAGALILSDTATLVERTQVGENSRLWQTPAIVDRGAFEKAAMACAIPYMAFPPCNSSAGS